MKPTRLFTADEGKKSVGLSGPDAIEKDIDVINTMFDPLKTHEDDSEGGIQEENLGTNLSKKVNDALDYSTDAVETLIPDLESNKADREEIYTKDELDNGQLDNRYYTETELNTGVLDGRYYTETELNNNQLGSLYYTKSQLSPFLAGGSVPIYTDKYTIVNSDNEDGTFTYSYKGQSVIGNIINEDTQVFTIEGNTYPHGNDSLLVYVDGVPFTSIEGNEVLELSNTTFGLKPIQSSDMVITIKYVNATGIIAVDNVIQQLEDVTQQSLDTIAEVENVREEMLDKADLDITGNVPVEQLGNTEYMKEWYGRGVIEIYDSKLSNFIDFDYLNKYGAPSFSYKYWRAVAPDNAVIKINTGGVVGVPYPFTVKYISKSTNNLETNMPRAYFSTKNSNTYLFSLDSVVSTNGTTSSAEHSRIILYSSIQIDLTNVSSIEFEVRGTGTSSPSDIVNISRGVLFGVAKDITNIYNSSGFDVYDGISSSAIGSLDYERGVRTIDVSSLTGLYYLKLSSYSEYRSMTAIGRQLNTNLEVYDIKLNSSSSLIVDDNRKFQLSDNAIEATIELPQTTLPTRALDWYSLNALVDTPPNTSVEYDLYDNHNVLLKGDVQNGETFRDFTNPIIVPKVTLKRNSLTDPKPTWERLTLGYRGNIIGGIWQKTDEFILDTSTNEISFDFSSSNEFKLICKLYTSNAAPILRAICNNDTTANNYRGQWASNTNASTSQSAYMEFGNCETPDTRIIMELNIKKLTGGGVLISVSKLSTATNATANYIGSWLWKGLQEFQTLKLYISTVSILIQPNSTFEIWER